MRHYTVNNIQYTVFESEDELPADVNPIKDWRKGGLFDWVLADDGCYIQILRKGTMTKPKGKVREVAYIGTCTGTFIVLGGNTMDTVKRKNIYSFGGGIVPIGMSAMGEYYKFGIGLILMGTFLLFSLLPLNISSDFAT